MRGLLSGAGAAAQAFEAQAGLAHVADLAARPNFGQIVSPVEAGRLVVESVMPAVVGDLGRVPEPDEAWHLRKPVNNATVVDVYPLPSARKDAVVVAVSSSSVEPSPDDFRDVRMLSILPLRPGVSLEEGGSWLLHDDTYDEPFWGGDLGLDVPAAQRVLGSLAGRVLEVARPQDVPTT